MVFVGGCLAVLFEASGKEDKVFKRCIEEGLRGSLFSQGMNGDYQFLEGIFFPSAQERSQEFN